ncbi:MAG: NYN domain-containing protein [Calditrichaeota bacterium]|nr:MAG: NYN domain-containing protein [Calditrichota bacterium]
MTQRVIAYIDGFNLYFGLKSKGWKRYYWLNLQKLVENLLKPGQTLICTDVNIATEMLSDAFQNRFDTMLLISADSDLAAPIAKVKQLLNQQENRHDQL